MAECEEKKISDARSVVGPSRPCAAAALRMRDRVDERRDLDREFVVHRQILAEPPAEPAHEHRDLSRIYRHGRGVSGCIIDHEVQTPKRKLGSTPGGLDACWIARVAVPNSVVYPASD